MIIMELLKILDIKNEINKKNEDNDINISNDNDYDEEKLKMKISQMENEIENNKNIGIKNRYLRKMVCLKLYKALNFALKNFELKEKQIKHICLYIEIQGRILDMSMGIKYISTPIRQSRCLCGDHSIGWKPLQGRRCGIA